MSPCINSPALSRVVCASKHMTACQLRCRISCTKDQYLGQSKRSPRMSHYVPSWLRAETLGLILVVGMRINMNHPGVCLRLKWAIIKMLSLTSSPTLSNKTTIKERPCAWISRNLTIVITMIWTLGQASSMYKRCLRIVAAICILQ